jgi:hypothetical protein
MKRKESTREGTLEVQVIQNKEVLATKKRKPNMKKKGSTREGTLEVQVIQMRKY